MDSIKKLWVMWSDLEAIEKVIWLAIIGIVLLVFAAIHVHHTEVTRIGDAWIDNCIVEKVETGVSANEAELQCEIKWEAEIKPLHRLRTGR